MESTCSTNDHYSDICSDTTYIQKPCDEWRQAKEFALAGDDDGLAQMNQMEEGEAGERVSLSAADEFLLPGASEGYDRQLNALKGLVAEDPARVAQAIRQWVNEDD